MKSYEESNLWKKHLANQGENDPHNKARDRLRDAFIKTRLAVEPLVGMIAKELPDLTVHDITHLDSLWHIADVLMGDEFELNPAEVFVLGISFLLHDTACSTFAYAKGIEGLRDTTEWKDFAAQNGFSEVDLNGNTPAYQQTLFETLRLLHPQQAEILLTRSWDDLSGTPRWLMEDTELRNYYGSHIGKIAASHGKDAAIVERNWANAAPLTPHSSLNIVAANWKVDLLKIAMLLRCVDAAHIDSKRAPDMLACLICPSGESKQHWIFQNHLGDVGMTDQNELYWSGQPFDVKDADAWWRCYNTVQMIDREIRTANIILKNNGRKELQAKGCAGSNDLFEFQQYVPVQDWRPINFNFQISQVSDVVAKFGGNRLYGDKPYLALRELIQNAADAIRARRIYRDDSELGRIDILLTETDGAWWLHVQDNGVGMSRYVLTDVLLDFGRSLWTDASLREQWKGLPAKNFNAIGQFGIGFYSVFMLGDEIKVHTWRDGDAEFEQSTLHLRNHTNSRPILMETPPSEWLSSPGTKVSVRLNEGRSSLLPKYHAEDVDENNYFSIKEPNVETLLSELVGILAPALDIDVICQDGHGDKTKAIVANDWITLDPPDLLKRVAPFRSYSNLSRLTSGFFNVTESDGSIVGRASLSHTPFDGFGIGCGVLVHQGIVVGRWNGSGILLSSNNEDLQRSIAQPVCSREALKSFGINSYTFFKGNITTWLSHKLLSLGLPADDLPIAVLAGRSVTQEEIESHIKQHNHDELVLITSFPDCPDDIPNNVYQNEFKLFEAVIDASYSSLNREEFGLNGWIKKLFPENDDIPRTTLSALHQCILRAWPGSSWRTNETRVVGKVDGMEIDAACVVYFKKA